MKSFPRFTSWRRFALLFLSAVLLSALPLALAQADEEPAQPAAPEATPEATPEAAPETAPETEPADAGPQGDPVLIRLGSVVERFSDIAWRFEVAMRSFAAGQGVPYTDEIAAQLRGLLPNYLEQRGTELVLLREAENRGFTPDEESVQTTLEGLRASVPEEEYDTALSDAGFPSEDALVTIIREGNLITQVLQALRAEAAPSDEEIRVRYLADVNRYTQPETFCARHILVEDEALATELVERAQAGEDFAALATEHGTDGTAANGGDLGCFQRGMMVAPFEEAVVAAEVGEIAGPIQTQFGYHALVVYEHRPAEVRPFEEVRDDVAANVAADAASAAMAGLLRGSGLVTYPERLETP